MSAAHKLLPPALLFILGNAWAAQYMSAKIMGEAGLDPVAALMDVHILLAAVFGTCLGLRRRFFLPTANQAGFFFAVALVGSVASILAELAAAPHIPASLLTIIVAMAPVFTLVLTLAMGTERLNARSVAAILLGLTATLAILLPSAEMSGSLLWIGVAFIAPLGFGAMGVIMSAKWPDRLDPLQVAFGLAAAGLIMLVPLSAFTGSAMMIHGNIGTGDWAC